jgi:signal transduction histidine kinase
MRDLLRKLPLFADLSDADLSRLCALAHDVKLPAGEILFREGESGDKAYVIQDGDLEILKVTGNRELLLAVRKQGELVGEASLLEAAPRMATVRARTDCHLIAIDKEEIEQLVASSATAARVMFFTALERWRGTTATLRQSEKMAQLGTLTAGVAHELNNPAAAARRAASQLEETLGALGGLRARLATLDLSPAQRQRVADLERDARDRAKRPLIIDGLDRSDREADLEDDLPARGVAEPWRVAPALVSLGYDAAATGALAGELGDHFGPVVEWLAAEHGAQALIAEIGQAAGRISEIVKALKSYSYLDQAPIQQIDLIEGIENTLVILRHKLKAGIRIQRDYAKDLPRIEAYGSELNQVWTNLLDNAADALDGKGQIAIRARQDGDMVVVDIEDDGPGIPENLQGRVFDAFFTTKPPGKGTGLGLNISYDIVVNKHRGDIHLESRPGKTRFEVRVPVRLGG